MMNRMSQITLSLLIVSVASNAWGQEKKPALWKWTSSSNSKESSMFSGPQINWPQMPTFQGMKASTGQAYNNAKQTTGRWWNNTVTFLNPWDEESTRKRSGNSGAAWTFQKKEESKSVSTLSDFMKQERPRW